MEVKPAKGLKVKVNARREAIFGDESVNVQRVAMGDGDRPGILTGRTLIGFAEVEMKKLDGNNHWYPIEEIVGEHGEKLVEEEVQVEMADDDSEESE